MEIYCVLLCEARVNERGEAGEIAAVSKACNGMARLILLLLIFFTLISRLLASIKSSMQNRQNACMECQRKSIC